MIRFTVHFTVFAMSFNAVMLGLLVLLLIFLLPNSTFTTVSIVVVEILIATLLLIRLLRLYSEADKDPYFLIQRKLSSREEISAYLEICILQPELDFELKRRLERINVFVGEMIQDSDILDSDYEHFDRQVIATHKFFMAGLRDDACEAIEKIEKIIKTTNRDK